MKKFSLVLAAGAIALAAVPAAHAADLLVQQPSYDSGYTSPSGGWDGVYAGIFAGYGWAGLHDPDTNYSLDDDTLDLSGWLLGANLGANFTLTEGVVAGVVGDIAWSGLSGYDLPSDLDYDVQWTGSVRGRLGYDAGAFMPYLTGGLAFAGATATVHADQDTQVHFGWTAGVGVEVAATEQLSVDLQYRYSDYGSATYDLSGPRDLDIDSHALTAGLNWKF